MIVFYILNIAILNLGVGFALAMLEAQGRRVAHVATTVPPSDPPPAPASTVAPPAAAEGAAEAQPEDQAAAKAPPPGDEEAAKEDDPRAMRPDEEHDAETHQEELTSSLGGLRQQVGQYDNMLAEVDQRLREVEDLVQKEALETCVEVLDSANHTYQEACDRIREAAVDRENDPACQESYRRLLDAVDQQSAQIALCDLAVAGIDQKGDPEEGCREILEQVGELRAGNHRVRDALSQAAVAVDMPPEEGGESTEANSGGGGAGMVDLLTGLANRAKLERDLATWWKQLPEKQTSRFLAVADADEFGRINEKFGPQVGDRILRAVGRLFGASNSPAATAARWCGERFAVLISGLDREAAVSLVERIRQQVHRTHFQYSGEDVPLTVRCAVTEVRGDDNMEALMERIDTALEEAKRYGRNRTFTHEGKFPSPVMPLEIPMEPKWIEV
jgi:diguanylate cyclase (GGDEF)-like protein